MYPRLNYHLKISSLTSLINPFNFKIRDSINLYSIFPDSKIFTLNNARSGLQIILKHFKGNVVGIQPFTCPTVLEAIESAGCIIHFIDINKNFTLDIESLKKECSKIDILIITHTFGYAVNIEELKPYLKNKILIEDCAHSFLSKKGAKLTGTFSDFSIFSFGFGKFPNAISGGFILCNNTEFEKKISFEIDNLNSHSIKNEIKFRIKSILNIVLHSHFIYTVLTSRLKSRVSKKKYHKTLISDNYKAFGFTLEIFNNTLTNIDKLLKIQKNNAVHIQESVKTNSRFSIPYNTAETNGFMFLLNIENPDELIRHAKKHGIEIGKHFYKSKHIIKEFGYTEGQCLNYESLIENYVTVACHYNYPEKAITKISKILKEY